MTRSSTPYPAEIPDADFERQLRRRLREALLTKKTTDETTMEVNQPEPAAEPARSISDYAKPNLDSIGSSIAPPPVTGHTFELKPHVIQMVKQTCQFDGFQDEDPYAHLQNFLEISDTISVHGIPPDTIRLRLFPFSIKGRAKQWLSSLPHGSITSWAQLTEKFLMRYFPPSKITKLRSDISSFRQMEAETLYDTWERYKEMLRKCPQHGIEEWMQVQTFYNGLNVATKQMLDAAANGSLCNKDPDSARELIDEMATNGYQWSSERTKQTKVAGVHELDALTNLTAKVEAMSHKLESLNLQHPAPVMATEEGSSEPPAEVNYVGKPQGNPYSSTYNPGWRNHPNFSYSTPVNHPGQPRTPAQGNPTSNQPIQQERKPSNLENMLAHYIQLNETRFNKHEDLMKNQQSSLHNLENQIGQIAKLLSERPTGTLPSNTEVNPRETVKGVEEAQHFNPS